MVNCDRTKQLCCNGLEKFFRVVAGGMPFGYSLVAQSNNTKNRQIEEKNPRVLKIGTTFKIAHLTY